MEFISYNIWLIGFSLLWVIVVYKYFCEDIDDFFTVAALFGCAIPIFFMSVLWNAAHGFTKETGIELDKIERESRKPVTHKTPLADGCFEYRYYASGVNNGMTTKFVRCSNATTTSYETYQCGTTKAPKTCTKETITQDKK